MGKYDKDDQTGGVGLTTSNPNKEVSLVSLNAAGQS